MSVHWILPRSDASTNTASESIVPELARVLRCTHPIASILFRKGITSPGQADAFLNPKLKTLSDPFLLPDMRYAVDRVLTAIDRRERIVLYGDYDVDGVTSLALLSRMLHAYDANPECFLPLRAEEGYGLTAEGIARCMTTLRPQLLIAVDCGTSSAAEIAQLSASGVDVVVLDHHECKANLPDCIAVVNPKRTDVSFTDAGDFRYLCSAGLVFKLCHALLKTRPAIRDFVLREYLDMVALATIADIVPLVHENRILVQKGLEQMAGTRWPGLRALLDVAGVAMPITPTHVGFQLGPRLNASGRLGTAQNSLELLLTDDPGRARTLVLE